MIDAETAFDEFHERMVDPPLCTLEGDASISQLGLLTTVVTVTGASQVAVCPFDAVTVST